MEGTVPVQLLQLFLEMILSPESFETRLLFLLSSKTKAVARQEDFTRLIPLK